MQQRQRHYVLKLSIINYVIYNEQGGFKDVSATGTCLCHFEMLVFYPSLCCASESGLSNN